MPPPALTLLLPADGHPPTRHALATWCNQAHADTCAQLCGPAHMQLPPHPRLYNATEPLSLPQALPLLPWQRLVIAREGQLYTFKVSYRA